MGIWFYADAQLQRQGPLSSEALVQRFHQGEVRLDTLVWKDGMPDWQPLRDFTRELALDQPPREVFLGAATAANTEAALEPAAGYTPYAPPAAAIEADAGVVAGGEVVLAGFWKRVAAALLDGIVVGFGSWIIAMVMVMVVFGLGAAGGFASGDPSAMGTGMMAVQIGSNLFSLLVAAAYYAGFHASSSQATLGKMAVGIKVVRADGHRITLARGIGRYFATWLSYLIIGIGFLMAAFTERKQGLHDMVCDTLVVDKWAYTAHPEWQRPGLGTVTVVILSVFGVMMLGIVGLTAVILGLAASTFN